MQNDEIVEQHRRAPDAARYMARAFLPSPGFSSDRPLPNLVERWVGARIRPAHFAAFCKCTGLNAKDKEVPIIYPHVFGFPLQLALLTHRAFPIPLWNALQIRNRFVQHRFFGVDQALELETRIAGMRLVDKGVEIDLSTRLQRGPDCVWKSLVTYFYRGRFGPAEPRPQHAASPDVGGLADVDRFDMPKDGRWRFSGLTGDHNGIHKWDWFARRFGFPAAFPHPQRVAGLCLARLKAPRCESQMLDLWIKGPLFYGAGVTLRAGENQGEILFTLSLDGDARPAFVGRWEFSPQVILS